MRTWVKIFIITRFFSTPAFWLGFVIWPIVSMITKGIPLLGWTRNMSIAVLLIAWWPHINLPDTTSFGFQNLLIIDYGFHIPLMISGTIMAYGSLNLSCQINDKSQLGRPFVGGVR